MDNRQASFGLLIGEVAEWGKGYGAEVPGARLDYAFGQPDLNRVWLHVDERNTRGIQGYQKVGFPARGTAARKSLR